jgi:hypothetical protein
MMSPYDPTVKFESRKLLTPFSPFNSGMSARDKVLERKKVILLKLEISELLTYYTSVYHTKDKKVIKYFLKSFKPEKDCLSFSCLPLLQERHASWAFLRNRLLNAKVTDAFSALKFHVNQVSRQVGTHWHRFWNKSFCSIWLCFGVTNQNDTRSSSW